MTSTTDGFLIAEADMKMRGPGDIEGTMQSGLPFELRIANLATDGSSVQMARDSADALLDADPALAGPSCAALRVALAAIRDGSASWFRIS